MEAIRKDIESDLLVDVFFTNLVRGKTPYIGDNLHWWIAGEDTGVVAEGLTPRIGANRHWWIGSTDTGVVAEGRDGDTPSIGSNGNWQIGGVDMGVASNGIPTGVIVMWSGSVTALPRGWTLCDGEGVLGNGQPVPNLKGRFIVGYDPGDSDYNVVSGSQSKAKTGGAKAVALGEAQMPPHNHWFYNVGEGNSGGRDDDDGPGSYNNPKGRVIYDTIYTSYAGGANPPASGDKASAVAAHENRPPYYVLAFIIKL